MTPPREAARTTVERMYAEGWGGIYDGRDEWTAAIVKVIEAQRREWLHEINRVFCNGLASYLDLEFMRDMAQDMAIAAAKRRKDV